MKYTSGPWEFYYTPTHYNTIYRIQTKEKKEYVGEVVINFQRDSEIVLNDASILANAADMYEYLKKCVIRHTCILPIEAECLACTAQEIIGRIEGIDAES